MPLAFVADRRPLKRAPRSATPTFKESQTKRPGRSLCTKSGQEELGRPTGLGPTAAQSAHEQTALLAKARAKKVGNRSSACPSGRARATPSRPVTSQE